MKSLTIAGTLILSEAIIFIGANFTAQAQTEAPDSVVRIAAESKGLTLTNPPIRGTFWIATDQGSFLLPLPWLPDESTNDPVFLLGDGQFLVDSTGGNLPQPTWMQAQRGITVSNLVERQGISVLDLIDQVQEAQFEAEMRELFPEMYAMDSEEEGGESMSSFLTFPDPGLQIVIPTNAFATAGQFAVILTNTIPDQPYDVLTKSDLNESAWLVEVEGIYATTNFIPVQLNRNGRTNLFVWARYAGDSTGSGMPDWWLLKYFGTTDADPYADPDNDGWNNLQEYQNGTSPVTFNTPPAPSGLAVSYDSVSGAVNVSWQLSRGPVTNYILVIKQYNAGTTTLNFSASTASFATNISAVTGDVSILGPTKFVSFKVKAQYALGDSSWSDPVLLEPNFILPPEEAFNAYDTYTPFLPISLIAGPQGSAYLAATALPPGTQKLRLSRIDNYAESAYDDHSFNTNWDIPVSALTNGLYQLPVSWTIIKNDSYGEADYGWWVQTINTSNGLSMASILDYYGSPETEYPYSLSWPVPLYLDARAQLKENLIFLLRAATIDYPFAFTPSDTLGGIQYDYFSMFSDYACAGYYQPQEYGYPAAYLDAFLPLANNYIFRNFVFRSTEVNTNGVLTNGVSGADHYYDSGMNLSVPPRYWFPVPLTNGITIPTLLATNQTRWLCQYGLQYQGIYLPEIAVTNINPYAMSYDANIYGLPFLSVLSARDLNNSLKTNILYAGSTTTNGGYFYGETAQPQFQTVEYDFFQGGVDWLPGHAAFSPTNSNHLLIASVGDSFTVAGYAKLGIQNGYNNVYGYLGQYFDLAYILGTNGAATTNSAGLLSPYGEFFPTIPGPAALVTMPDIDTGQRGTGIVQVVKLQLDVNHDGVMDLSFAGPDNTSQANPMKFWVNNDHDWSYYIGDLGVDVESLTNYPDYIFQNIQSQRDLEDDARLWICGIPALPLNGGYQVTMSWNVSGGNPAINLVMAIETNGGTLYLTDSNTAAAQTAGSTSSSPSYKFARVTPSQPYTFPASYFTNAGNKYLLFEGAGIGVGQLTMTISVGTNAIAQTSTWLDLRDAKNMFEHVHIAGVTNVPPGGFLTSSYEQLNSVDLRSDEDTDIVVFVHGWRMGVWDYENFSQTMFKRLYWQGYRGRFASIRWNTLSVDDFRPLALGRDYFTYNQSEFRAWESAKGVSDYLTNLKQRFPNYNLNVCAHSMGNVVMAEALKLQLAASQQNVNNFVLMQAAVPASCYDTSFTNYAPLISAEQSQATPNTYQAYPGAINGAISGQMVNFYNTNDYALATGTLPVIGAINWEANQVTYKPDQTLYYYTHNNGTVCENVGPPQVFITDSRERMSFCARPRSKAVGAQAGVSGVIQGGSVDLNADFGFFRGSDEHSAQFNWPIQRLNGTSGFYQVLLQKLTQ